MKEMTRRVVALQKDPADGVDDKQRNEFERYFLRAVASDRVSSLLEDLGITQATLARRIGKSEAWVSKALSGNQNLTLDTLSELGWALGVRWDPRIVEAPLHGTPALNDPPLPAWVGSMNADILVLQAESAVQGGTVAMNASSTSTLFLSFASTAPHITISPTQRTALTAPGEWHVEESYGH